MELKPCRWCGLTPHLFSVYFKRFRKIRKKHSLRCPVCGNIVYGITIQDVREAWNHHAGEEETT